MDIINDVNIISNDINLNDINLIPDEISILDINTRFYLILNHFCISLTNFSRFITYPILYSISKIKRKWIRNHKFNKYVNNIEVFNGIINEILVLIQDIIKILNLFFLCRNIETLVLFIDKLKEFFVFVLSDNIFTKLTNINNNLHPNTLYQIADDITNTKYLISDLFDITINIAIIFEPLVVKSSTNKSLHMHNYFKLIKPHNMNFNYMIRQLIDIQFRSQIILNMNLDKSFQYNIIKETDTLLHLTKKLQLDYTNLLDITIQLKKIIIKYKKRKQNPLSFIRKKINLLKQ
jgi:hypothetical protein